MTFPCGPEWTVVLMCWSCCGLTRTPGCTHVEGAAERPPCWPPRGRGGGGRARSGAFARGREQERERAGGRGGREERAKGKSFCSVGPPDEREKGRERGRGGRHGEERRGRLLGLNPKARACVGIRRASRVGRKRPLSNSAVTLSALSAFRRVRCGNRAAGGSALSLTPWKKSASAAA
jgi:hypothetical protein